MKRAWSIISGYLETERGEGVLKAAAGGVETVDAEGVVPCLAGGQEEHGQRTTQQEK
jgi:hypothetical protein